MVLMCICKVFVVTNFELSVHTKNGTVFSFCDLRNRLLSTPILTYELLSVGTGGFGSPSHSIAGSFI